MSEQTKAAMDAAIAAHVADETDGDTLSSYVLQTMTTSIELMGENQSGFIRFISDRQQWVTSLGLIDYARVQLHHAMLTVDDG
jgi:hypothetical protein